MVRRSGLTLRLGLVVVALLMAACGIAQSLGAAGPLDRALMDAAFRFNRHPQAPHEQPVIIGIDEAFLDSVEEPLALSHAYLARLLDAMATARPRVLGLDLVLPEKRFDSIAPAKPS